MAGTSETESLHHIASLSFEDALQELERIVKQMEEGRGKLDDAVADYAKGVALRNHCQAKLDEAQTKIRLISQSADGKVTSSDFSADAVNTINK